MPACQPKLREHAFSICHAGILQPAWHNHILILPASAAASHQQPVITPIPTTLPIHLGTRLGPHTSHLRWTGIVTIGHHFNKDFRYRDFHYKDRLSWDFLIIFMGFTILVSQRLCFETAPRSLVWFHIFSLLFLTLKATIGSASLARSIQIRFHFRHRTGRIRSVSDHRAGRVWRSRHRPKTPNCLPGARDQVPVWDDILTPTIFWPRGQNIVTIYWPPLRYFDLPYNNQWQSFICLLYLLDRICHLISIISMNF